MAAIKVPFLDLHAQYLSIRPEIDDAIAQVISQSAFIRGPFVDAFEEEFARTVSAKHCVSCANGTDAIYIALRALRLEPGDEVIVPAHTWISTAEAVTQAGGTVVFCDTDQKTFTIDPRKFAEKVTARTVGVIPVHLYGQSADMDPILELARRHKLWVVEDCAQAHIAKYKGRPVGSMGTAATYSFYPSKNLGAMGDAGAITTNDRELADRMTAFARHGGFTKGEHLVEGINSRLDGLQAAILSVKLRHLKSWTAKRQQLASQYLKLLAGVRNLELPTVSESNEHVFHLFVVRHERRDMLVKTLSQRGIQTSVNYPIALPFLPAYKRFGHHPHDFPSAFSAQSRILSLPLFPELSEQMLDFTVDALREFS